MSTGEKNLSVNFKDANGVLYTFRADSPTEFVDRVNEAEAAGMQYAVAAVMSLFGVEPKATHAITQQVAQQVNAREVYEQPSGFQPVPPPVSTPTFTSPTPQAVAPTEAGTRNCVHGPMIKRAGEGQYGPYKGYYCPTPKGTPDQCKPVYIKKGTPEWNAF